MYKYISKNIYQLNNRPIRVVCFYLLLSLVWIFLRDRIGHMLLKLTQIKAQNIDILIDASFLLVSYLVLFLLIRRQLLLHTKSNDQYKVLLHANPTPMWIFNRETLMTLEVNNIACHTYGYSAQEFSEMTILNITSSEDRYKTIECIKSLSYHYIPTSNFEHIKKNGELITAKVTANQIIYRNQNCIMVMAEDVTMQLLQKNALKLLHLAEKENKEELEFNIRHLKAALEEKERLAEVLDRIHNMVIITDPLGVITWVNEAFINTTGYTFDEAVGKTQNFLHGPKTDPAIQEKIKVSIKKRDYSVFEIINYSKRGKGYWVEITISAIYDDNNKILRYISVQNIITERKFIEQQIIEQNSVLKKLAWANSHLVRKPIASIISLVDLGKNMEKTEDINEIHHLIARCSIELDNITKEVSAEINSRNLEGFMEI